MTNVSTEYKCVGDGTQAQVHFKMHGQARGTVTVWVNDGERVQYPGNAEGIIGGIYPPNTPLVLHIERNGSGDVSLSAGNTGERCVPTTTAPPTTATPTTTTTTVVPPVVTGQTATTIQPRLPEVHELPATGGGDLELFGFAAVSIAIGSGLVAVARRWRGES